MAFRPGHRSYFALDSAAGSLVNLSIYIDTVDAPQSVEMLDVSTLGSSVKNFIPGLSDGDTISISGPMDVLVHQHFAAVKAAQTAGTAGFTFLYGPGGSIAGQPSISAECYLAGYAPPTSVSGRAEWNASLQVTGVVTMGTL